MYIVIYILINVDRDPFLSMTANHEIDDPSDKFELCAEKLLNIAINNNNCNYINFIHITSSSLVKVINLQFTFS